MVLIQVLEHLQSALLELEVLICDGLGEELDNDNVNPENPHQNEASFVGNAVAYFFAVSCILNAGVSFELFI